MHFSHYKRCSWLVFSPLIISFQPAIDWVVVRFIAPPVHLRTIRLPIGRAHDIVDAHPYATLMVRPSKAIAGSDKAVGQSLGDTAMGIGYRSIVEIATNYHAHSRLAVLSYILRHSISLGGTLPCTGTDLGDEELGLFLRGVPFRLTMNKLAEPALVLRTQPDGLKVVVDKQYLSAVNLQEESLAEIALRLVMYALMT